MENILTDFECNLSSWADNLNLLIEDIKNFAPKGSNGEIEECSYLKVKQAQLEVLRNIQFSFKNILEKLQKEEPTQKIFDEVFAILTKCISEDGFFVETDSDVSINGNVLWYELEKLANKYGVKVKSEE